MACRNQNRFALVICGCAREGVPGADFQLPIADLRLSLTFKTVPLMKSNRRSAIGDRAVQVNG